MSEFLDHPPPPMEDRSEGLGECRILNLSHSVVSVWGVRLRSTSETR